jgi:hypothetical protein
MLTTMFTGPGTAAADSMALPTVALAHHETAHRTTTDRRSSTNPTEGAPIHAPILTSFPVGIPFADHP